MVNRYEVEYELDGVLRELIVPASDREQAKKFVESHTTMRLSHKGEAKLRIMKVRKLSNKVSL